MIGLEEWDWTFRGILVCWLCYGSTTGINGVGTGFYHLPLGVEFPLAPIAPWDWSQVTDQLWDLRKSYGGIRIWVLFPYVVYIVIYICGSPEGSAPTGGGWWHGSHDEVLGNAAGRCQGWETPTLYRRLALSLPSPAISLSINHSTIIPHPCVQPYRLIYPHTQPYTGIRPSNCMTKKVLYRWQASWSEFLPTFGENEIVYWPGK